MHEWIGQRAARRVAKNGSAGATGTHGAAGPGFVCRQAPSGGPGRLGDSSDCIGWRRRSRIRARNGWSGCLPSRYAPAFREVRLGVAPPSDALMMPDDMRRAG